MTCRSCPALVSFIRFRNYLRELRRTLSEWQRQAGLMRRKFWTLCDARALSWNELPFRKILLRRLRTKHAAASPTRTTLHIGRCTGPKHQSHWITQNFTTDTRRDAPISELMASIDGIEALPRNSIGDLVQATSECDVVISDRLHILIAATLAGTPIIPILSRPKLRGYVEYLSYPFASGIYRICIHLAASG